MILQSVVIAMQHIIYNDSISENAYTLCNEHYSKKGAMYIRSHTNGEICVKCTNLYLLAVMKEDPRPHTRKAILNAFQYDDKYLLLYKYHLAEEEFLRSAYST